MHTDWKCPKCGCEKTEVRILSTGPHHWQEQCALCGRWIRFLPKPDSLKAKRPKAQSELVHEYGREFCELCGILQRHIPNSEALEAHHVIEYQDGGQERRSNIWIVCTRCHRLIHWMRTYLRHLIPERCHEIDESTARIEAEKAVDQLDDRPPWR